MCLQFGIWYNSYCEGILGTAPFWPGTYCKSMKYEVCKVKATGRIYAIPRDFLTPTFTYLLRINIIAKWEEKQL